MTKTQFDDTTLLLSHYNFGVNGPIHGPVHSITSYFKKNNKQYRLIAHPLYNGAKTIVEDFVNGKVSSKDFGIKINLPIPIKSLLEIVKSFWLTFNKKYKLIIAVDPLNALIAIISKYLGISKTVIYYTADYADKRFDNIILNYIYHKIDMYCVKKSDYVWNVSTRIVQKRKDQGLAEDRNLYVPNSPLFSSVERLDVDLVDRNSIVMITGRTHDATIDTVIRAFAEVVSKFPQAKLTVIGPIDKKLPWGKRTSDLISRGKILMLGQMPHEQTISVLRSSGLGLALYTKDFPWTYYGDSMKAREYALCGVPVIITDAVSTSKDIQDYNAGEVAGLNEKSLANVISKILGDKNYWLKLRTNAIKMAQDFDFEKLMDKYLRQDGNKTHFDNCVVVTHGVIRGPAHEIRDYLRKISNTVMFVSHPLLYIKDNYAQSSEYEIYKDNKLINKIKAIHWIGPELFLYVKDFIYSFFWVYLNPNKIDFYVGSGNLNALVGIVLKKLGKVDKVVFYCIDYVPYRFENKLINYLYHWVDRLCAIHSDVTWNLSKRMIEARNKRWNINFNNQIIVPHGSYLDYQTKKLVKLNSFNKYEIIFTGSILKKQGLQLVIQILPSIINKFPKTKFKIVGVGNYKDDLEQQVVKLNLKDRVFFLGYLSDSAMQKEMSCAHVAIAPYAKSNTSFSFYGDPGKVKHYLSLGIPIIITDVPEVAKELKENNCGIVIRYNAVELKKAISKYFTDDKLTLLHRKNSLKYASLFGWNKMFSQAIAKTYSLI